MAVDSSSSTHQLYICDYGSNAIKRITLNGIDYPMSVVTSSESLSGPTGVAIDTVNKMLYVTCAASNLILKFDLSTDVSSPTYFNILSGKHPYIGKLHK